MKHTIYIVEDNRHVREALSMLIDEEPDLEVCGIAGTAAGALDMIRDVKPDLVLTDLSLPGMSGIELIERLQAERPEQRVVVVSAHLEPAHAEQALAAGAAGYYMKGDPSAIIDGIRQALAGEANAGQSVPSPPSRPTSG